MSSDQIKPMLAEKAKQPVESYDPKIWIAEEKFDGHRAILIVYSDHAEIWSRLWKPKKISPTMNKAANRLPIGVYDGELCASDPDGKSWNVPTAINSGKERLILFDAIAITGVNLEDLPLWERRNTLEAATYQRLNGTIQLSRQERPSQAMLDEIYERGGEGLILKRITSTYQRRRSHDWLKVKARQEAELQVINLKEGTRPGVLSIAEIRDREGNETSVKIRNEEYVAAVTASPEAYIGRWMEIEYQLRTEDGLYRHPMMKRWVGED